MFTPDDLMEGRVPTGRVVVFDDDQADWADAGIRSVQLIGDAAALGPIAWATYAGHRYAREIDTGVWTENWGDTLSFRREITELAED